MSLLSEAGCNINTGERQFRTQTELKHIEQPGNNTSQTNSLLLRHLTISSWQSILSGNSTLSLFHVVGTNAMILYLAAIIYLNKFIHFLSLNS